MMRLKAGRHAAMRQQRGAAGLEFALQFTIFFAVFYALVSYGLAMMLIQAFNHAAAEGARASVRLDPLAFASNASYETAVKAEVATRVRATLQWLPPKAMAKINGDDGVDVQYVPASRVVNVRVRYVDYKNAPLVPFILNLPGIGTVPQLPDDLVGSASLKL